jgi:hypothetical protein
MRFMWLWVLLYALVVGFLLAFLGFTMGFSLATNNPGGIFLAIGIIANIVCIFAVMVGFLVFIAGFILLLIRGKFAKGRVLSLIGIGFYYVAALGLILQVYTSPLWGLLWEIVVTIIAIVVFVGLPGFFITRSLRQAQKMENIET